MDNWELKLFFRTIDNDKVELGSYKGLESKVVAEWLLAGYTQNKSRFFLALYDDDGNCVNAKFLSDRAFNQLIIKCYID